MIHRTLSVVRIVSGGLFALTTLGVTGPAIAKDVPRSFEASPEIYRVVATNDQFKIIEVTYKPGQHDQFHSHKTFGIYFLTGCDLRRIMPDGTTTDFRGIPMGWAQIDSPVQSHAYENIGGSNCKLLHFEQS